MSVDYPDRAIQCPFCRAIYRPASEMCRCFIEAATLERTLKTQNLVEFLRTLKK
jgi:hypothetical protein